MASSLVLLVFRAQSHHVRDYGSRLRTYFNRDPEMLQYIRDNPLFIYVVLYQCFNNFNTILYQFEKLYKEAVSPFLLLSRARGPDCHRQAGTLVFPSSLEI